MKQNLDRLADSLTILFFPSSLLTRAELHVHPFAFLENYNFEEPMTSLTSSDPLLYSLHQSYMKQELVQMSIARIVYLWKCKFDKKLEYQIDSNNELDTMIRRQVEEKVRETILEANSSSSSSSSSNIRFVNPSRLEKMEQRVKLQLAETAQFEIEESKDASCIPVKKLLAIVQVVTGLHANHLEHVLFKPKSEKIQVKEEYCKNAKSVLEEIKSEVDEISWLTVMKHLFKYAVKRFELFF